jgi:hypothetical protein
MLGMYAVIYSFHVELRCGGSGFKIRRTTAVHERAIPFTLLSRYCTYYPLACDSLLFTFSESI